MKTGWKKKSLGDLTSKITDGSHNPPKGISQSSFLMLSSKNVYNDKISIDNPRYLTEDAFRQEHKRTRVSRGDLLLTIVGTIGRCAVVDDGLPQFTLQRSVAVIGVIQDRLLPRFLMYSMWNNLPSLLEKARGVAQQGIYLETVRSLQIAYPSIDEQIALIGRLDKARSEISDLVSLHQNKLALLQELNDSLLHASFS